MNITGEYAYVFKDNFSILMWAYPDWTASEEKTLLIKAPRDYLDQYIRLFADASDFKFEIKQSESTAKGVSMTRADQAW